MATDMETVFGERPVWEAEPVEADTGDAGRNSYVVKAGDTGIAIARAYGIKWQSIVTANSLSEPFVLRIGQRLIIPQGQPAAAPDIEARAASFRLDIDDILTGGEPAQSSGAADTTPQPGMSTPLPPSIAVREPSNFTGNFIWPVKGNLIARFGPVSEGQINQGIEISTGPAEPIRASSDGVVAFVGNNVAGYGGMILIRHGQGWITAYGRAARTTVTRGQSIKRGEIIGYTGTGSGPQLHFEMRQQRKPVDPLKHLPPA